MVPEDAYSSMLSQQQQLMPPIAMQLSNLDTELKSILNNPSLNVDEKYNRYYRTFNRYSHLQGNPFHTTAPDLPQPPPQVGTAEKGTTTGTMTTGTATTTGRLPVAASVLLDSLPKVARHRGRLLVEHMKNKDIEWNEDGELLENGAVVSGSNIIDLFHFFTRDRPSIKPPNGAKKFADILQKTNVPMEAVVPDSFNQAGTLNVNIGTVFSPKKIPTPKKTNAGKTKTPPSRRKISPKVQPPAPAATSGDKRKRVAPQRYGNWEHLKI